MLKNVVIAITAALIFSLAPPSMTNAEARNSRNVTVTITPQGEQAYAIRSGLQIYSLFKSAKNRAAVNQRGESNGAAIAQNGSGNTAQIFQRGRGNEAAIQQTGNNNWLGVFQFGRNTRSNLSQTGNGKTGLVLQGGW